MMSFKRHLMAMGSAIALMTGAAPAFAYNNRAYISQPGNYNNATQDQTGDGNYASMTQSGNEGTSHQTQDPSNNTAIGIQTGPEGNDLTQTQIGNGNYAHSYQNNPGPSESHNYAVQLQIGNNMSARIS